MAHDQPTYASVPGIRVFGMMCVKPGVSVRKPVSQAPKRDSYYQQQQQQQGYHNQNNQYQSSNYQYLHRNDPSRLTVPNYEKVSTINQYDDAYGRHAVSDDEVTAAGTDEAPASATVTHPAENTSPPSASTSFASASSSAALPNQSASTVQSRDKRKVHRRSATFEHQTHRRRNAFSDIRFRA